MKKILRLLANIIAVLGFLGSFVMANYGGQVETSYGWEDRDYGLTFGIFVGCCLSVAVVAVLLYGFAELLEMQEKALTIQEEIKETEQNILKCMSNEQSTSSDSEENVLRNIDSNLPKL